MHYVQLLLKLMMKHLGSSLRNPLKYTKQNNIKTNTTLETLKHNFDNFEHDGIGWLVVR
jgi:hypothetical protein